MKDDFLNTGIDNLRSRFNNPGNAYRGKPFWSWNGELEEKKLLRQAEVMKEMGLGGYFMHSRAGLITEYLGEEWFKCINAVADRSEEMGMEAWLYDEDRWPSGSAGGMVTKDPKYRMKSLYVYEMAPELFKWDESVYSAFAAKIDGINIYEYTQITPETDLSEFAGYKILKFSIVYDKPESNYNGTTYIDTMMREAVDRFIELTHERYARECGERISTSISGIFSDEPHRGKMMGNYSVDEDGIISCAVAWTDDIFDEFRKRYGYDPEPILPELFYRKDGEKLAPIKHDYIDLSDNLFIERFAMPINEWCINHGIDFTGHILHEDSLINQTVPSGSVMRFYQHMGVPGIDILSEGNSCYWVAKQLDSAARQTGKNWKLSELYGCTGWQMDFKGHKAIGAWQAFFGINLRCHHLSWYTMEGESKRDYPASILHQAPWHKDYNYVESYFARFGVVMTEGESTCDILVLNPVESVWAQAYLGWANWIFSNSSDVNAVEAHYASLFHLLSGRQIDFDYGEEQMMAELGSVELAEGEPILKIGNASYKKVVVSGLLTVRSSTLRLLKEFADIGGKIVFTDDIPEYVDARRSDGAKHLSEHKSSCVIPFAADEFEKVLKENSKIRVYVNNSTGTPAETVFCRTRKCDAAGAVFAVFLNVDRVNSVKSAKISIKGISGENMSAIEIWNLENGEKYDIKESVSIDENGAVSLTADFEATDEIVIAFLAEASPDSIKMPKYSVSFSKNISGEYDYILNEPNVCVLDFAKWRFNGGEWNKETEILKLDRAVRDRIGIERRGGEMLQPWFAKKNYTEEYGRIEIEYSFFVDEIPDEDIVLCAERPEEIKYSINGCVLECTCYDDFWIDDCFKKMNIDKSFLKKGVNRVTAEVVFKRTTNIEAVYLTGNFGVKISGINERHIIKPASALPFDDLKDYGLPFYSGSVSYVIHANSFCKPGDGERAFVRVDNFRGALVKIAAVSNPSIAKIIAWHPQEADITDFVLSGEDLLVTVVCSRRSTFGPLHLVPAIIGAYGPGEFMTEGEHWSDSYVLLPSGLEGSIIYEIRKKT